jgi:hypothetical protein
MGKIPQICLLALALAGCNTATELRTDNRVPAATGRVEAKASPNQNTELKVEVKYLAPPSRVRPGASTYVVWAQGLEPDALPQNLGALRVNDKLSGTLTTVTPLSTFSLFLTPEESPVVQAPTGEPLMKTLIKRH